VPPLLVHPSLVLWRLKPAVDYKSPPPVVLTCLADQRQIACAGAALVAGVRMLQLVSQMWRGLVALQSWLWRGFVAFVQTNQMSQWLLYCRTNPRRLNTEPALISPGNK
jgi:hypothetical protein